MVRAELVDAGTLKGLLERTEQFVKQHERLLNNAAAMATGVSQETFRRRLSGRGPAPDRSGRPTTQGGFAQAIQWQIDREHVRFQWETLEDLAPYWLIQEIGTGEEATILDEARAVSVQSQVGRPISKFLVWADASGEYSPLGRKDQLMTYKDVRNAPYAQDLEPRRIGKEIEGKHYIQQGGRVANKVYRTSLLSLAQETFAK